MAAKRKRSVQCNAVDESKFKHTIKPETETDKDSRLLADFNHYFPELGSISTTEQMLSMVNMNFDVREWYKRWSSLEASALTFPDFLDKSNPKDLDEYALLTAEQATLSAKNKDWNGRIKAASDNLKKVSQSVETEKRTFLGNLKPYHAISLISVNNLPLDKQAQIASTPAKSNERKELTKQLILEHQKLLKQQVENKAFKNPFSE